MSELARHPELRAGGTDLSQRRRSGVSQGEVADIRSMPELAAATSMADGGVRIGSLVTIAAIAAHPVLRASYPGLTAAAGALATPQIRTIATLGGNLAQRSRCWYFRNSAFMCFKKGGKTCPARLGNHLYAVAFDVGPCIAPHPSTLGMACLAYEATITTNIREHLPIAQFFGDGRDGRADHMLAPGETILFISLPPSRARERSAYRRVTARAYAEWPLIEAMALVVLVSGRVSAARLASNGIAPVPLRLQKAENALIDTQLDPSSIAVAASLARATADFPCINTYKLDLLERLIIDLLENVAVRNPGFG
jgi:xanthine dehydrogenase YagS FAD-binding subunit